MWAELPLPDRYQRIPPSSFDVSVQDLAQLYAAFARDCALDTNHARNFSDAVAMHRLIDKFNDSSSLGQVIRIEEDN